MQRGDEEEGFYGFLPADIKKERQRIKSQQCKFCKQKYANVACCKKTCKTFFHLKCGYNNKVLFQFKETFMSFCERHYPFDESSRPKKGDICHICQENIGKFHFTNTIKAPCCQNGWFHKWCLSEYALNAGYFFKCPLCQNGDTFRDEVPYRGVFIPDKDAEWETEPNAFQELLERPDKCSCDKCFCHKGRNYKNDGAYKLKFCKICGASAAHERCIGGKYKTYECAECKDLRNSSLETIDSCDEMTDQQTEPSTSTEDLSQTHETTMPSEKPYTNKRKLDDIYENTDFEENRMKHRRTSVNLTPVRRSTRRMSNSTNDSVLSKLRLK